MYHLQTSIPPKVKHLPYYKYTLLLDFFSGLKMGKSQKCWNLENLQILEILKSNKSWKSVFKSKIEKDNPPQGKYCWSKFQGTIFWSLLHVQKSLLWFNSLLWFWDLKILIFSIFDFQFCIFVLVFSTFRFVTSYFQILRLLNLIVSFIFSYFDICFFFWPLSTSF